MTKETLFTMLGISVASLALAACEVTTMTAAKGTAGTAGAGAGPAKTAPPPRRNDGAPPRKGGVVRDWRSGHLGSASKFTIEPSIGPVGTVVNIYGSFRPASGGAVACSFMGAQPTSPYFVSVRRMVVRVPDNARSGPVSCKVKNETLWSGRFFVTRTLKDIFVPMNEVEGVLGAVYRIPANTARLPNFNTLGDPIGTFVAPTIHVSPRGFEHGFPGVTTAGDERVNEWYAIRYVGMVEATKTADYTFKVKSSDGARLSIDDKVVVDNDGVHAPTEKEGSVNLTEGKHRLVVEYFKGAGSQIAIELWWKRGPNPYSGVAKHSLSRYTVDDDCSVQPAQIMCCKALTDACKMCAARGRAAMDAWRAQCSGN